MTLHRRCVLAVVFLTIAGCGQDKPGPTGVIYEGKHVSEWGEDVNSPDRDARLKAAKTLVKLGREGLSGKEAIQALEKAIREEDPVVRGWIAVALNYCARGTPYPVSQVTERHLKVAVESSDEELRREASRLLERMQAAGGGRPGGPGGKQGGGDGPPMGKRGPRGEGKGAPSADKDKGAPPADKDKGTPPLDKNKGAPPVDRDKGAPPADKDKGTPPPDKNKGAPLPSKNEDAPPKSEGKH